MDETQASSAANPATENETPQHSEQLAATSSSTPNGNMAEQDDSQGAASTMAAVAEPAVEAETATEQAAANADAARSAVDQTAASSDQPTSDSVSPSPDHGGTAPAAERSMMADSSMTASSDDSSMAADHAASITASSEDSSMAAASDDHSTAEDATPAATDTAAVADTASATASPATAASSTSGDEIMSMEDLMRESDGRSFRALRFGDVVEGTIMHVSKDELLVDIQAKSEGIVPVNELQSLSPQELSELHVGDTILVSVVQPENNEGHAVLSLDRARQEKSWRKLQKQFENNELIETHVTGYNKGGLLVNLEGVRGFVPSSQVVGVGNDPAKQNELGGMSDRPINLKIIEINRNRNRLILSERLAMQAQRDIQKEKLLSELKPGDVKHGRVVSIADFGAFVDIGGADGLIHLSELSWSRVTNPHDVLKVGQEVDVYVLGVDENERKIALSLKRTQAEPWSDINNRYQIGQMVSGTITQLASFGAFARIADGVEGLIHISELSDNRVLHPRDVVKEGDKLELRIIRIDPQRKRIGLSLKRAHEGASMEGIEDQPGDLGGEPRPPRQDRGDRGGDRGGDRNGGATAGTAAGGVQNSRFERMERAASERATGGSDRTGRDRPRRDDRRDSGPMQTTYGSTGGMTAMEQAMAAAMAAQRDGEDGDMDSNQDTSDSPRYTTQETAGGYTSTTQDGGEAQSAPTSTNHGYEVNSVTNSADNAESSASATHDSTASTNNQNASRSELQESLMGSSSTGQSNAAYEQMSSGRDAADDPTSGQTPPTSDALNNRNNSQQAAAPANATEESGAGSEASIQAGEAGRPATTSSVEDSEVTQHDGDTSGSR